MNDFNRFKANADRKMKDALKQRETVLLRNAREYTRNTQAQNALRDINLDSSIMGEDDRSLFHTKAMNLEFGKILETNEDDDDSDEDKGGFIDPGKLI